MTTVAKMQSKILARKYKTVPRAMAAVRASGLTKPDQKTMLDLIAKTYNGKTDHLAETADIGKLVVPLGSSTKSDLEKEVMRIALRCHYLMGEHKISREQLFDRLKEVMIA